MIVSNLQLLGIKFFKCVSELTMVSFIRLHDAHVI